MSELAFHPVADIFPLMTGAEFAALVADIAEQGQHEPIRLLDGMILDGRNRYRACVELGLKPMTVEWQGNDPLTYVMSENLRRRHLDESQRAMIGARIANMPLGANQYGSANLQTLPVSQADAAQLVNVSTRTVASAVKIRSEAPPELIAAVDAGQKTVTRAIREINARQEIQALGDAQAEVTTAQRQSLASVCDLRVCSCRELFASGIKPDAVITDPPYPEKFLPVFSELAESCALADVPLVAVMSGQSYLAEVMQRLCAHLTYRWTLAYLLPGGQAVQAWPAKVNTFWKPVLLFGQATEWIGDVARSKPNDNDKRFHEWGQSESGMVDLVDRLTKPGQLVCDPFLGGGTTAVAALAIGRRFVGCDTDAACVEMTRSRVEVMLCLK